MTAKYPKSKTRATAWLADRKQPPIAPLRRPSFIGLGILLALMAVVLVRPGGANATSSILGNFNSRYGTTNTRLDSCSTCHTSAPTLNAYGEALRRAGRDFGAIEGVDSDGDGWLNIEEIGA